MYSKIDVLTQSQCIDLPKYPRFYNYITRS